jgi:hypothetical protein
MFLGRAQVEADRQDLVASHAPHCGFPPAARVAQGRGIPPQLLSNFYPRHFLGKSGGANAGLARYRARCDACAAGGTRTTSTTSTPLPSNTVSRTGMSP